MPLKLTTFCLWSSRQGTPVGANQLIAVLHVPVSSEPKSHHLDMQSADGHLMGDPKKCLKIAGSFIIHPWEPMLSHRHSQVYRTCHSQRAPNQCHVWDVPPGWSKALLQVFEECAMLFEPPLHLSHSYSQQLRPLPPCKFAFFWLKLS